MSINKASYFEYLAQTESGTTECRVSVDMAALPFIVFAFMQLTQIFGLVAAINVINPELKLEALKLINSCKQVVLKLKNNNINPFPQNLDPEILNQSAPMLEIEFWKALEDKINSFTVME